MLPKSWDEIITSPPLGILCVALGAVSNFPSVRWFFHGCFSLQGCKQPSTDTERFGLCAYSYLFSVASISLHLPVLCYTYRCSLETSVSLTESGCTNLSHLCKTMWQGSSWNPLPQYCYFTCLKILWLLWMIWKIRLTFSNKLLSSLLHTGMEPEPACRARKAGGKSRELLVMPVKVVDPLAGFWMLYKEVTLIHYKLKPLGEVGQRELEVVTRREVLEIVNSSPPEQLV